MSFYRKPVQRLSDLWQTIWNQSPYHFLNNQFSIPELQINGDGYHAVQVLARVIWRIRPEIGQIIEQHKNNLNIRVEGDVTTSPLSYDTEGAAFGVPDRIYAHPAQVSLCLYGALP